MDLWWPYFPKYCLPPPISTSAQTSRILFIEQSRMFENEKYLEKLGHVKKTHFLIAIISQTAPLVNSWGMHFKHTFLHLVIKLKSLCYTLYILFSILDKDQNTLLKVAAPNSKLVGQYLDSMETIPTHTPLLPSCLLGVTYLSHFVPQYLSNHFTMQGAHTSSVVKVSWEVMQTQVCSLWTYGLCIAHVCFRDNQFPILKDWKFRKGSYCRGFWCDWCNYVFFVT